MRITRWRLMAVLLTAGAACSRNPTPSPSYTQRPKSAVTKPSARQVHNDAVYQMGPEHTWAPTAINERPGLVRIGETTREELVRIFGYPTHRREGSDGAEVWYYASGLRPVAQGHNPFTTRSQRVAAQRKVIVTFAADSTVVTHMRTLTSGERAPDPFLDTGPALPELEPEIIPAPEPNRRPHPALYR